MNVKVNPSKICLMFFWFWRGQQRHPPRASWFLLWERLPNDDKASLLKPGARGLEGAAAVAELAEQNPAFFPASLMDAAELRADLELGRQLGPMARALRSLADALDDTVLAANSDAYRAALKGYALAKLAAKSLPGMDAKLEPLAEIFDRRRRKKSASDPA